MPNLGAAIQGTILNIKLLCFPRCVPELLLSHLPKFIEFYPCIQISNVTIKNVSWPHFSWATLYMKLRKQCLLVSLLITNSDGRYTEVFNKHTSYVISRYISDSGIRLITEQAVTVNQQPASSTACQRYLPAAGARNIQAISCVCCSESLFTFCDRNWSVT